MCAVFSVDAEVGGVGLGRDGYSSEVHINFLREQYWACKEQKKSNFHILK
ncbi:hypothetical protein GL2_33300 [Microbulbifer sp. GL-2]|nr:hypothetical protein GL2_33300 [Microbulbifer sp. GL-2]